MSKQNVFFIFLLSIFLSSFLLTGCTSVITLDQINQQDNQDISSDSVFVGVLSDIHGELDNLEDIVDIFNQEDLDLVVIAGDLAEHYDDVKDHPEIIQILLTVSELDMPILVIPGNHDLVEDYSLAVAHVSARNIIDMSKIRTYDVEGLTFVSNPYGYDFTYLDDGYKGTYDDLVSLEKIIEDVIKEKESTQNIILLTHQPPLGNNKDSIDFANNGENVGNKALDNLIKQHNIPFTISGHIHEAGGIGVTNEDLLVVENEFSDSLKYNPGALKEWTYNDGINRKATAGILEFKDGKVRYSNLVLQ